MIGKKYNIRIFSERGLTLVEMLVAVAILVIVITVVAGIFVNIIRVQRRTSMMQKVQQDARYAIESITKEFRMGKIDYGYYGTGETGLPVSDLAIINSKGEKLVFKIDKEKLAVKKGETEFQPITSSYINDLNFYISPFPTNDSTKQQRVTFSIELKPTSSSSEKVLIQTTITSRNYE